MNITLNIREGHDGNGSPIAYYVISNKKFTKEFNTKREVTEYIEQYLNYDWSACATLGKLIEGVSEES